MTDDGGWAPIDPDAPRPRRPAQLPTTTPTGSFSPPQPSGPGNWPPPSQPAWGQGTGAPLGAYGAPLPKAGTARTGPLPLHPMTVGDILDGAFKLFRANLRTVVLIVAALYAPVQLGASFLARNAFSTGFLDIINDPTVAEAAAENQLSDTQLIGQLLAVFLTLLITPFIAGAIARVVAASYLGEDITVGAALMATLRRSGALLGAFILIHLLEAVGFVACVLPALAVMAMFVMTAPAIVVEELGPIAGMRRSWNLVKPRFWPVLGVALLSGLIASFIGNIISFIPSFIALFLGGTFAWLLVAVTGVAGELIVGPIVAIVATLLYFDARIRHEGFDLRVMAADLAATR